MIIDFHTHVFSPRVRDNRNYYLTKDPFFCALYQNPKAKLATADDLVASMDKAGVDVSVICGFGWTEQELCEEANDYVLEAISRFPQRLIGFCVVQPKSGAQATAEVRRCAEGGMRGIGELMPDGQNYSLNDFELLDPIMEVAREHHLSVLTHTSEPVGHSYPGKGRTTPEITFAFASRFADLSIICAHWGGGLPFYHLMPEIDQALANVHYDTAASFLIYRPDIFRWLPKIVGVEKILLGSDYPLVSQSRFIKRITALGLPSDILDPIFGNNARRLLGL